MVVLQRQHQPGPGGRSVRRTRSHLGLALDRQNGLPAGSGDVHPKGMAPAVAAIPLQRQDQGHRLLARRETGGIEVVEDPVDVEFSVGGGVGVVAKRRSEYSQGRIRGPREGIIMRLLAFADSERSLFGFVSPARGRQGWVPAKCTIVEEE